MSQEYKVGDRVRLNLPWSEKHDRRGRVEAVLTEDLTGLTSHYGVRLDADRGHYVFAENSLKPGGSEAVNEFERTLVAVLALAIERMGGSFSVSAHDLKEAEKRGLKLIRFYDPLIDGFVWESEVEKEEK
jgi:hypothetical protein